ncbi:plastocyanin/azurin family copper-binding protein [Natronomonas marina]|uniref:plastocyanin/azurin family copper-binding protein n=1 Tax=Natronomonas marina TaxID=2961939 RepID=UPI0020CA24F7|nr:plastocyanin/azurin family copper-binding protein [Natronomonas marina]
MSNYNRRTLLHLGGVTAAAALAGCSGGQDDQVNPTDTSGDDPTATDAGDSTPGADVLGGPDDLQSSATVEALSLEEDRGAGQFVFSPAVAWVESGSTVTFEDISGSHSVTAYHSGNDKPNRVPSGAEAFDSGVMSEGDTFEHTVSETGVYNYYCTPHEGLGMVGLVVVEEPAGGPGTEPPENLESSSAAENLSRLLELAGVSGGQASTGYTWIDATWDSYWYSLYNMSTNIAMSANGVLFPHNEQQQQAFEERFPKMLEAADTDEPPVKNPNLNMAAFTEGDPAFTEQPVLSGEDGRPDASTLQWDKSKSSGVVSPSSLAWTHLKGVTWAKNFENHFEALPPEMAAQFRSEVLTTLAQIGIRATLVAGGPEGNGALTKGDSLRLVSGFRPSEGAVVDETSRPHHHAAMLWFLSDLTSLAQGEWFGYVNPEPLIPPGKIQQLTDGMAQTTMGLFGPSDIVGMESTRSLGLMLGAVGWYGTHAGDSELEARAGEYANDLAEAVESNLAGDGRVENGADNQAATQGVVGQGLLWASELDGVDHADTAESVLGYLTDDLWDEEAGVYASGTGDDTYTITARDAGDITGGINAANFLLEMDVQENYASFFNQTFNRGRLQRAERPQSRDESAEYTLPLPPAAGGEFGQAAVYNAAVEYDTGADEWSVADRTFDTEGALYLANQDIWISHWGGDFYQGRGVPGRSDEPK